MQLTAQDRHLDYYKQQFGIWHCQRYYTQAHREAGSGDTSPGPPNLFQEKGPQEAFLFLGCIFALVLLLLLSMSGLNE